MKIRYYYLGLFLVNLISISACQHISVGTQKCGI